MCPGWEPARRASSTRTKEASEASMGRAIGSRFIVVVVGEYSHFLKWLSLSSCGGEMEYTDISNKTTRTESRAPLLRPTYST